MTGRLLAYLALALTSCAEPPRALRHTQSVAGVARGGAAAGGAMPPWLTFGGVSYSARGTELFAESDLGGDVVGMAIAGGRAFDDSGAELGAPELVYFGLGGPTASWHVRFPMLPAADATRIRVHLDLDIHRRGPNAIRELVVDRTGTTFREGPWSFQVRLTGPRPGPFTCRKGCVEIDAPLMLDLRPLHIRAGGVDLHDGGYGQVNAGLRARWTFPLASAPERVDMRIGFATVRATERRAVDFDFQPTCEACRP